MRHPDGSSAEEHATIDVERATLADLDVLTALFLGYLEFYEAPAGHAEVKAFLGDRMGLDQAIALLARSGGEDAGFTLVYPTFSSVRRAAVWTLNDLYVRPEHRRSGVGRALVRAVVDLARQAGVVRVVLSTDESNTSAQALYEAEGFLTGLPVRHYLRRVV